MSFEDAICVVITEVFEKYGYEDLDIELTINESLKNIGQSSSIFSSLALGITKFLKKDLNKKEISDIAYLGDVVAHGGTPSGIDNSVVTYGGYITYRKSEGPKPLDIDFRFPLIIVSSGEPSRTNVTVPSIRKQREENPNFVNPILERLNEISVSGLEYLKTRNLEKMGKSMTNYYEELRKLNISTKKLDKIIEMALKNKALGAKPTGGWGGGSVIVLAENEKDAKSLIELFNKGGFDAFETKLGVEGVKIEDI
jgi:mevalonate kinase